MEGIKNGMERYTMDMLVVASGEVERGLIATIFNFL